MQASKMPRPNRLPLCLAGIAFKTISPGNHGEEHPRRANRFSARIYTLPAQSILSRHFANSTAPPYTNEERSPAQRLPGFEVGPQGCACPIRAPPRNSPILARTDLADLCHSKLQSRPLRPHPRLIRMTTTRSLVRRAATTKPSHNFTLFTKDASIHCACVWWEILRRPKT